MSKNILFISPNPIWGGAATANLAIAKMLQGNGYNVVYNDEYVEANNYNGVKIDHTPIHQKKFSDRSLLTSLVGENNIDCIVWSPLVAVYFYGEIKALKKQGIKQISIVHSLSLTKDLKGRLMDYIVSLTLAQMTTIVYVSQYTMDSWSKFRAIRKSNTQQVVIHNSVDLSRGINSKLEGIPRIGFVGRLSDEKQPQIFCELSNHANYKFLLFGNGPLMDTLRAQYPNVDFKGQCNDIEKIYAGIDLLVLASKFENCPMVILEAQSYGIPCIAPRVGGIPELIETGVNGILYDGYECETIISAIEEVLSDYSIFSENSIKSSQSHTAQNTISYWEAIL